MYVQVQISTPNKEVSQTIIQQLLEERLIACGQIVGPITSMYHWNNQIEQSEEYLCFLKTTKDAYPLLERKIIELHPYDVPEIIVMNIAQGHKDYFKWITEEVKNIE